MGTKKTLHKVWDGDLSPLQGYGKIRVERLLGAFLPLQTIYLTCTSDLGVIQVIPESLELMPGLPAGDVIAEELDIDVPYGAMIIVDGDKTGCRDISDSTLSAKVGSIVGETLVSGVARGNFSLKHETDALYQSACSFHKLAGSEQSQNMGLDAEAFRRGLALALGRYWSGRLPNGAGALFLGRQLIDSPEVRLYLKSLDSAFSSPRASQVPASLMQVKEGLNGYEDWVAFVKRNVTAELSAARVNYIY